MSAETSCGDVARIQDEEVLRQMWQETQDFAKKKEIRSHMYKLREERLRDVYGSTSESSNETSRRISSSVHEKSSTLDGGAGLTHADSLTDHSFLSLKSKEIRDSESPTRDVHYRIVDTKRGGNPVNQGWNVVSKSEKVPGGYSVHQLATTSGEEKLDRGVAKYAAQCEQQASTYEKGDDKNFVKSFETSSKNEMQQMAQGGDENSSFRSTSNYSTSSSKVVQHHQSANAEEYSIPTARNEESSAVVRKTYANEDIPEDLKKNPNYVDGNTKVTTETRTLSDGTQVTTTRYETKYATKSADSTVKSSHHQQFEDKSTKSESINRNDTVHKKYVAKNDVVSSNNFEDNKNTETQNISIKVTKTFDDDKNFSNKSDVHTQKVTKTVKNDKSVDEQDTYKTTSAVNRTSEVVRTEDQTIPQDKHETTTYEKIIKTTNIQDNSDVTDKSPSPSKPFDTPRKPSGDSMKPDKPSTSCYTEPETTIIKYTEVYQPTSTTTERDIKTTKVTQTQVTEQTNRRISVEVSPTHDAFARSLRAVTPDRDKKRGSTKSLKSSFSSLRSTTSPDKVPRDRTSPDYKPRPDSRESSPNKKTSQINTDTLTRRKSKTTNETECNENNFLTSTTTRTQKFTRDKSSPDNKPDSREPSPIKKVSQINSDTLTRRKNKINDREIDVNVTITRTQKTSRDRSSPEQKPYPNSRESSPTKRTINSDTLTRRKNRTNESTEITKIDSIKNQRNITGRRSPSPTSTVSDFEYIPQNKKPETGKDKPQDKVFKRRDTYEDRCRQILGITETTKDVKTTKSKPKSFDVPATKQETRPLSKSPEKVPKSPTKMAPTEPNRLNRTSTEREVTQTIKTYDRAARPIDKEQSPTRPSSNVPDYPPEPAVEPVVTKKHVKTLCDGDEFPHLHRGSPCSPPKTFETEKQPTKPLREYPSQVRKSPDQEKPRKSASPDLSSVKYKDTKIITTKLSRETSPVCATDKPSKPLQEYPAQVRKSPEKDSITRNLIQTFETKDSSFTTETVNKASHTLKSLSPERKTPERVSPQRETEPSSRRSIPRDSPTRPTTKKVKQHKPKNIQKSTDESSSSEEEEYEESVTTSIVENFESQNIKEFDTKVTKRTDETRKTPSYENVEINETVTRKTIRPEDEPSSTEEENLLPKNDKKSKPFTAECIDRKESSTRALIKNFETQNIKSNTTNITKSDSRKTHLSDKKINTSTPQRSSPKKDVKSELKPTVPLGKQKPNKPITKVTDERDYKRMLELEENIIVETDINRKPLQGLPTRNKQPQKEQSPVRHPQYEEHPDSVNPYHKTVKKDSPFKTYDDVDFYINNINNVTTVYKSNNVTPKLPHESESTLIDKEIVTRESTVRNVTTNKKQTQDQKNQKVTKTGQDIFKPKSTTSPKELPETTVKKPQTTYVTSKTHNIKHDSNINKTTVLTSKFEPKNTRPVQKKDDTKQPKTTKRVPSNQRLNVNEEISETCIEIVEGQPKYPKQGETPVKTKPQKKVVSTTIELTTSKADTKKTNKTSQVNVTEYRDRYCSPSNVHPQKPAGKENQKTPKLNILEYKPQIVSPTRKPSDKFPERSSPAKQTITRKVDSKFVTATHQVIQKEIPKQRHVVTTTIKVVPKVKPEEQVYRRCPNKDQKSPLKVSTVRNVSKPSQPQSPSRGPIKTETTKNVEKTNQKVITTKSIVLNNELEDEKEVIIKLQRSTSSREPTPNRICPQPVLNDEDSGNERFPDEIIEPGEPTSKPAKLTDLIEIDSEESHISEYTTESIKTIRDKINKVDELDESLLTVNQKVSKFSGSPKKSDKVNLNQITKSGKPSAFLVAPGDYPQRPKSPKCENYPDHLVEEERPVHGGVTEKINKFIETAENVKHDKDVRKSYHTALKENVDDFQLSVSEKVNKFTNVAGKNDNKIISLAKLDVIPTKSKDTRKSPIRETSTEVSRRFINEEKYSTKNDHKQTSTIKTEKPTRSYPQKTVPNRQSPEMEINHRTRGREDNHTYKRTDKFIENEIRFNGRISPQREKPSRRSPERDFASKSPSQVVTECVQIEDERDMWTKSVKSTSPTRESPRPKSPEKTPAKNYHRTDYSSTKDVDHSRKVTSQKIPDDTTPKTTRRTPALSSVGRLRSTESMRRAKELFENMAKTQTDTPSKSSPVKKTPTCETNKLEKIDVKEGLKSTSLFHNLKHTSPTKDSKPESPTNMHPRERSMSPSLQNVPHYMWPLDRETFEKTNVKEDHFSSEHIEINKTSRSVTPDRNVPGYMRPLDRTVHHVERRRPLSRETTPDGRNTPREATPEGNVPGYMRPLNRTPHIPQSRETSPDSPEGRLSRTSSPDKSIVPGYMRPLNREPQGKSFKRPESRESSPEENRYDRISRGSTPENGVPGYMKPLHRHVKSRRLSEKNIEVVRNKSEEKVSKSTSGITTKFGVTLRRTDSGRRVITTTDDGVSSTHEIENIFDLHILELLLEQATTYDQRRKIRAQIRVVKLGTQNKVNTKLPKSKNEIACRPSSRMSEERDKVSASTIATTTSSEYYQTTSYQAVEKTSKTGDVPREKSPTKKQPQNRQPEKSNVFGANLKPTSIVNKTVVTDEKPSWITQKTLKKASENTSQNKKTFVSKTQSVKKETAVAKDNQAMDAITSSYGVGPTDENGSPLFGLRALRAQKQADTTKVQGTVIRSHYYSENGQEPRGEISVTKFSNQPSDFGDDFETGNDNIISVTTTQKFGGQGSPSYKALTERDVKKSESDISESETSSVVKTSKRRGSVKELTKKYVGSTEIGKSEKVPSYPKAGLILRSSSFKDRKDSYSSEDDQNVQTVSSTSTSQSNTFLTNKTRISGVQDVITRMKNSDTENRPEDTPEDREARNLLNKFIGSQVILSGMEMHSSTHATSSSPSSVKRTTTTTTTITKEGEEPIVIKRTFTHPITEEELSTVWDEDTLKLLLERCTEYEERKIVRSRLREVMAEQKVLEDVVPQGQSDICERTEETSQGITSLTQGAATTTQVTTTQKVSTSSSSSSASTSPSKPISPFAKFRQLDKQNSINTPPGTPRTPTGSAAPLFKFTDPELSRKASTVKERLLQWCQMKTKEYENVQLDNFSSSWADGLGFCALIHHFLPDAFDYQALTPKERRHNFSLAFRIADEKAGIMPLLDVDDMMATRKPDWKCVFTYVQTIYSRFKNED